MCSPPPVPVPLPFTIPKSKLTLQDYYVWMDISTWAISANVLDEQPLKYTKAPILLVLYFVKFDNLICRVPTPGEGTLQNYNSMSI